MRRRDIKLGCTYCNGEPDHYNPGNTRRKVIQISVSTDHPGQGMVNYKKQDGATVLVTLAKFALWAVREVGE